MQLRPMLRLEGAEGNENRCGLLDAFPGQSLNNPIHNWRSRQPQAIARELVNARPIADPVMDQVGFPVMNNGTLRFVH